MKPYPLLSQASHHEHVWGSGDISPHILNLSTRWRQKVSITPGGERAPGIPWIGGQVVCRTSPDAVSKRKIPSPFGNKTPVIQPIA